MEIIELSKVDDSVYQKNGHALASLKLKELVHRPEWFKLAIRCCDGTYHLVNSEIAEVVRGGIARSEVKLAINALIPIEPIHGRRYVIFEETSTGKAYLLGTVENTIVMLAGNH